jgi:hypothetical protein
LLLAVGLAAYLDAPFAFAGPAAGRTGEQQRQTISRLRLVCENDRGLRCPADPDDGYCVPGSQGNRIFNDICNPGVGVANDCLSWSDSWNACVPEVVARTTGTLRLSATEVAPSYADWCSPGDPECIDLQVGMTLDLQGASGVWTRTRSFRNYGGFPRSASCQASASQPGLAIADWFPFPSRDCAFGIQGANEQGVNFEGLLVPTNWLDEYDEPVLSDLESALQQFAADEFGLPLGSVIPTALLDSERPPGCTGGLGCSLPGNAVWLRASDVMSDLTNPVTGARTRVYPLDIQFATVVTVAPVPSIDSGRRLTQTSPAEGFGVALAASNDVLVVGADGEDVAGQTNVGAAYVFRRGEGGWAQEARLLASDFAGQSRFGLTVATSGDRIVVGASRDDVGSLTNAGSVYVFRFDGQGWPQEGHLFAPSPSFNAQFGRAVAVRGGRVAVGAYSGGSSGTAFLFDRTGSGWSGGYSYGPYESVSSVGIVAPGLILVGNPLFGPLDEGAIHVPQQLVRVDPALGQEQFGSALAAWEGVNPVVAVTAPFGGGPAGSGPGQIFVYDPVEFTLTYPSGKQRLSTSDGVPIGVPDFPSSIATDGERIVVASRDPSRALAYVFRFDGDRWHEFARLVAPDAPPSVNAVAVAGTDVFVGGGSEVRVYDVAPLDLAVTGTAAGGEILFATDALSLPLATRAGESAAAVARRLADLLEASGVKAIYVPARGRIELVPTLVADFPSVTTTDPGLTAALVTDCRDGVDDDGDALVDLDDPGCADVDDLSEHSPLLVCDDGVDNDGDAAADFPQDVGCRDHEGTRENPQCQDGIDNDGDGRIDFDGGASRGVDPPTAVDTGCFANGQYVAWDHREKTGACGLGFELVALVPLLVAARRRRRAAAA